MAAGFVRGTAPHRSRNARPTATAVALTRVAGGRFVVERTAFRYGETPVSPLSVSAERGKDRGTTSIALPLICSISRNYRACKLSTKMFPILFAPPAIPHLAYWSRS